MLRYEGPRPRRRCPKPATDGRGSFATLPLLVLTSLIILILCPPVIASDASGDIDASSWTERSSSFTERRKEIVVVDRGVSPPQPRVDLEHDSDNHPHGSPLSISTETSGPSAAQIEERSAASDDTSTGSFTTSLQQFPTPLDTARGGNNFTSDSCPKFIDSFLNNATVSSCHAISMLLQNSQSFFNTLKSPSALTAVLATACSSPMSACTEIMSDLASRMIKDDACGADYKLGNPTVTQTYAAMIAYQPIYQATCLKDPSTNAYCFVQAYGNNSKPDDAYVYFLPLGMAYPASSRPTCNQCLRSTMNVFGEAAQAKGQPLTQTYIPAALQINLACGPDFVNAAVAVGTKKAIAAGSREGRGRPNMELMGYVLMLSLAASVLGIH